MPPNKCLCLVIPANLYTTWWAPWVFALGGALVGFLLTLAFLHGVKALVSLCLAGCQPKRAWPDCCCWKEVSLELHSTPSWNKKPCFCAVDLRHPPAGE